MHLFVLWQQLLIWGLVVLLVSVPTEYAHFLPYLRFTACLLSGVPTEWQASRLRLVVAYKECSRASQV